MMWTDDPVADAAAYDAEQERELKKRPLCCKCGEHIQEDFAYDIFGDLYCDSCAWDWLHDQQVNVEVDE